MSEHAIDRLVELLFLTFPALNADELHRLIDLFLTIAEAEVRRQLAEERRQWLERTRKVSVS